MPPEAIGASTGCLNASASDCSPIFDACTASGAGIIWAGSIHRGQASSSEKGGSAPPLFEARR